MHLIPDVPDIQKPRSDETRVILQQILGHRGFALLSPDRQDAYLNEPGEFAPHEIEEVRSALLDAGILKLPTSDVSDEKKTGAPSVGEESERAA